MPNASDPGRDGHIELSPTEATPGPIGEAVDPNRTTCSQNVQYPRCMSDRTDLWLLRVIKAFHTAIWLSVETAFGYLIVSGITKRSHRLVVGSAAVVAAETVIYVANGFRCPLTELAQSLGAESGSVTDLYLPRWLARSLPVIHAPLVLLALYLHRPTRSGTV
jgi:hypothetical protein